MASRFQPGPGRAPKSGGGRGIRTPERVTPLTVFKTAAFNHSAIPPSFILPDSIVLRGLSHRHFGFFSFLGTTVTILSLVGNLATARGLGFVVADWPRSAFPSHTSCAKPINMLRRPGAPALPSYISAGLQRRSSPAGRSCCSTLSPAAEEKVVPVRLLTACRPDAKLWLRSSPWPSLSTTRAWDSPMPRFRTVLAAGIDSATP